jgi:glycosyltransferase involved in cell wall biosynthesis
MDDKIVTVITPTIGSDSLFKLIESLKAQTIPHVHIMLWDEKRVDKFLYPEDPSNSRVMQPSDLNEDSEKRTAYSIDIPGRTVQGAAAGSALRSIGLMAANTKYVTFADDDVWFEPDHLEHSVNMLEKTEGSHWGYVQRIIWTEDGECLGLDDFESVGAGPQRKVQYEMVDNSSMIFAREFGSSGACLYRETADYNDDRLMYGFLVKHAGTPVVRFEYPTVNQVCPEKLEDFFRQNCTKIDA